MDAVAFWSIVTVVATILVLVVIGIRVGKQINSTHSHD